jgi:hypothetical protein
MDIKQAISGIAIVGALGGGVVYQGTLPVEPIDKVMVNEVVSQRTANKIVFKTANKNQFQARVYSTPVNYKATDGSWKTIDTTLQEKAFLNKLSGYEYEIASGIYNADIKSEKEYNYRFRRGNASVAYEALFDTAKAVTIKVQPTTTGIKETVILADNTAPSSLSWKLTVEGFVRSNSSGGWTICDQQANDQFMIEPLTALDANGKVVPITSTLINGTLTAVLDCKDAVFPVEVDPTTTVTILAANSGTTDSNNATYLTGRNATTVGNFYSTPFNVGQGKAAAYDIYRTFSAFIIPEMTACSACTLHVDGAGDYSTTDFNVNIFGAHSYRSTVTATDVNKFNGWQSSGAYNGTLLNDLWNTSSYSSAWNNIIFNAAGRDSLVAAKTDTLWIAMLSDRDVAATEPSGNEFIELTSSTAYLSITYSYSPIKSPTGFRLIPIAGAKDSMAISWDNNWSSSIDSLRLMTYPGNVKVATLTKTASSARIGGLSPFTKYVWYVRADSNIYNSDSLPDSCYTLQTFKTENISLNSPQSVGVFEQPNYNNQRGQTNPDSVAQGQYWIGQYVKSSTYTIVDLPINFILPKAVKILSDTLYLYGTTDNSKTDFSIQMRSGKWHGTPDKTAYYNFWGWETGVTPYTGVDLITAFSTAGFSTVNPNKLVFTKAGLDTALVAQGDTMQVSLVSSKRISATAPTDSEFVEYAPLTSYLKHTYAPPDTIPAGFTLSAISADSVLASWTDRSYSERGFVVWDVDTGAKVAGTDTTANDVTSLRIGGLSPNAKYRYQVKAVGGGVASTLTAYDSTYTKANTPGKPTTTYPAATLMKFVLNMNSNPAWTEVAVQDSITGKYVYAITGPDSFGTLPFWGTYAIFGGSAGDTVAVGVGKKYNLRAKAKSGE